jgi:heme-degrading monooxygenase HmoA
MIAVIFEALPVPGKQEDYFAMAAQLRPVLEKTAGFISIERFQSTADPARLLSLSFWEDEAAVAKWRNTELHRHAQDMGRSSIFADYRLRIAHVVRDYGMHDRAEAPQDSIHYHHKTISNERP